MKNVTDRIREFYDELNTAKDVVTNICGALSKCTAKTNLTDSIGIYARNMPKFKFLKEERTEMIQQLCAICIGEIPPEKGLELFTGIAKQLDDAISCIKL